jgi:hypothetical protein
MIANPLHSSWPWDNDMADLRSTPIFSGVVSSGAVRTLYTVPAGKRLIIKHVTALEVSGSSCDAQLRTAATGTIWVWHLTAYGTGTDKGVGSFWIVLGPGEVVQFNRTTAGQLTVTVSGSLHTI